MKKAGFHILLFLLLAAFYTSCDKKRVFDNYHSIQQTGWHKDSLMVFEIPVTNTIQNHNLVLQVRNDIKYKYSNLWVFIEILPPSGKAKTDTVEVVLADEAGKWLGNGFGGIKTTKMAFKRNVYFPLPGTYKINIQHGMRSNVIRGITDVGFRVEKQ